MKIGMCGGIDRVKAAGECGFDYFETKFKTLALSDDNEYNLLKNELKKYNISCEAANAFFPPEMRITGRDIDYNELSSYMKKGFGRAQELGVKICVIGSSGARNVPENYSYRNAVLDLIHFMRDYASPLAEEYGITVVFEPLCKRETNIINTVKEGAMIASAIDKPNIAGLCDLYHMYVEGDTYDDIRELKGIIKHAHISNPNPGNTGLKRIFMKDPDEFDYKSFFDALKYAGCERVSIEAETRDVSLDAPAAKKIMNMYK